MENYMTKYQRYNHTTKSIGIFCMDMGHPFAFKGYDSKNDVYEYELVTINNKSVMIKEIVLPNHQIVCIIENDTTVYNVCSHLISAIINEDVDTYEEYTVKLTGKNIQYLLKHPFTVEDPRLKDIVFDMEEVLLGILNIPEVREQMINHKVCNFDLLANNPKIVQWYINANLECRIPLYKWDYERMTGVYSIGELNFNINKEYTLIFNNSVKIRAKL